MVLLGDSVSRYMDEQAKVRPHRVCGREVGAPDMRCPLDPGHAGDCQPRRVYLLEPRTMESAMWEAIDSKQRVIREMLGDKF